ncbi:MAG: malectin domain-containing carbohydrate-binding protein [Bacteroidales bacterium]
MTQVIAKKLSSTMLKKIFFIGATLFSGLVFGQAEELAAFRQEIPLNKSWTTAFSEDVKSYSGFEQPGFLEESWKSVNIPHNWEDYQGYQRLRHGSLHGYAFYRKSFDGVKSQKGKRYFLYFEGVSSYATVWLNGVEVGTHAGGRTTFTLDVTDAIRFGGKNVLAVRADHPAGIQDLPWVCGGCSSEWGFSEGSQPFGIFRPVSLIVTDGLRIEPFGVHVWNDEKISEQEAVIYVNTEIKNYTSEEQSFMLTTRIINEDYERVAVDAVAVVLDEDETIIVEQKIIVSEPHLWSPNTPYLHRASSEITEGKKVIDRQSVFFGIRHISFPAVRNDADKRFLINGKPFFINGTGEYEHNMGKSHAFTDDMIDARVAQIRAAGFNAFRDAHNPHNLRYSYHWNKNGILWWPQFSSHIWFDNSEFKENFKNLLVQWVKENRNNPSLILWGLQNESTLPEKFAKECADLIRELDPTASKQRLITTCNGGDGADWNVPQNWSGTYGGDPKVYDKDMERQLLNGEYGSWRSLGMHSEGTFDKKQHLSESRMTELMEMKVRLAEKSSGKSCGHFQSPFNSHENPGRRQNGEGVRELDRLGPINYKGLITPWGEPTDAFYMYRSNYASQEKEPMIYIAMHTWADRWIKPGIKKDIVVYSNCDVVELWCDTMFLGRKERSEEKGTHFTFNDVEIKSNLLHVYGTINGIEQVVASDVVLLNHLPKASFIDSVIIEPINITKPKKDYYYIYRVNCGGPNYIDINENLWSADVHKSQPNTWGSLSWTDDYKDYPPFYGSQRYTNELIHGTLDGDLFRTFRYGQHKLRYEFPVPEGDYQVEIYFAEPWYGRGGGINAEGWRKFDIAINNKIVKKDFDIYATAGYSTANKQTFRTKVIDGKIEISFPNVSVGQAIVSAIAISTKKRNVKPAKPSPLIITNFEVVDAEDAENWSIDTWLNNGVKIYTDDNLTLTGLPPEMYAANYIRVPKTLIDSTPAASFVVSANADVYVALADTTGKKPWWMRDYSKIQTLIQNSTGQHYAVYTQRFEKGATVTLSGNISDNAPTYFVAVNYATSLESASDLRPIKRYEAEYAKLIGKAQIDKKSKREFVTMTDPFKDTIEFSVLVNVADKYDVRVRYTNELKSDIPMQMEIRNANDSIVFKDKLMFKPTPINVFKNFDGSTGVRVKAGKYKIRFANMGFSGITLDYIELQ